MPVRIQNLRADLRPHPLNIVAPPPMRWELLATGDGARGVKQAAYRILAAASVDALVGGPHLFDSGKVATDESAAVWTAPLPAPGSRIWWNVEVFLEGGPALKAESPACFEIGLPDESAWGAHWISAEGSVSRSKAEAPKPAPMLRRAFRVEGKVSRARLHLCGLGFHLASLNGRPVGDSMLAPAFTAYDRTALYETFDVTGLLVPGENALGVVLGSGWYDHHIEDVWNFYVASWRDRPKLLCRLEIEMADGTREAIVSDRQWKATLAGPIVSEALRVGSHYDARHEFSGWDAGGFDDRAWHGATLARPPGGVLKPSRHAPVRRIRELAPSAWRETIGGAIVFDFPETTSGWAKLSVEEEAGTTVTATYAEELNAFGQVDRSPIQKCSLHPDFQVDRYTCAGRGQETWEPRFQYHGFRHVELRGLSRTKPEGAVKAVVVHNDFPEAGSFACSSPVLNRVQDAVRRSLLTNWHGLPTDCPQREKNGWTGDAQLSCEANLFNFDSETAWEKWIHDLLDAQRPSGQLPGIVPTGGWGFNWGSGPAWDSALVLIPWYLYLYRGNTAILERSLPAILKYLAYMASMAEDGAVAFGLGDWLDPRRVHWTPRCPVSVTDTAYWFCDTRLASSMARALGNDAEAARLEQSAQAIRQAWNRHFVDPTTGIVSGDVQTSYACALYHDLVEGEVWEKVAAHLVRTVDERDGHIDCGILGTKWILEALVKIGRGDLAYAMASKESFPSWGWFQTQGATTLWEDWSIGSTSRNHHMFGSVGDFFYRHLAGIQPDPRRPGFREFTVAPVVPKGLEAVSAKHRTPQGEIAVEWKVEAGQWRLDLAVPANTRCRLVAPAGIGALQEIPASTGSSAAPVDLSSGGADLGSGVYRFQGPMKAG